MSNQRRRRMCIKWTPQQMSSAEWGKKFLTCAQFCVIQWNCLVYASYSGRNCLQFCLCMLFQCLNSVTSVLRIVCFYFRKYGFIYVSILNRIEWSVCGLYFNRFIWHLNAAQDEQHQTVFRMLRLSLSYNTRVLTVYFTVQLDCMQNFECSSWILIKI